MRVACMRLEKFIDVCKYEPCTKASKVLHLVSTCRALIMMS